MTKVCVSVTIAVTSNSSNIAVGMGTFFYIVDDENHFDSWEGNKEIDCYIALHTAKENALLVWQPVGLT